MQMRDLQKTEKEPLSVCLIHGLFGWGEVSPLWGAAPTDFPLEEMRRARPGTKSWQSRWGILLLLMAKTDDGFLKRRSARNLTLAALAALLRHRTARASATAGRRVCCERGQGR